MIAVITTCESAFILFLFFHIYMCVGARVGGVGWGLEVIGVPECGIFCICENRNQCIRSSKVGKQSVVPVPSV